MMALMTTPGFTRAGGVASVEDVVEEHYQSMSNRYIKAFLCRYCSLYAYFFFCTHNFEPHLRKIPHGFFFLEYMTSDLNNVYTTSVMEFPINLSTHFKNSDLCLTLVLF